VTGGYRGKERCRDRKEGKKVRRRRWVGGERDNQANGKKEVGKKSPVDKRQMIRLKVTENESVGGKHA